MVCQPLVSRSDSVIAFVGSIFLLGPQSMDLPIPIIDLTADDEQAAQALGDACTEHGFFFGTKPW